MIMRVLESTACCTHSDALFSASSRNRSDSMHNAICKADSFVSQSMFSSNCALVFSHYLCPFITLKIDYIVEFFSIIIGFLISAIALLHSSNIRIVLYNTKSEGYPNYWYKIISYYRVAIIYFLFLILVLVVKIDSIPDGLYQEIYLAILIEGVYWVLKIVVSLFYLLTVEINSK